MLTLPGSVLSTSHVITNWILISILWNEFYYYPHVIMRQLRHQDYNLPKIPQLAVQSQAMNWQAGTILLSGVSLWGCHTWLCRLLTAQGHLLRGQVGPKFSQALHSSWRLCHPNGAPNQAPFLIHKEALNSLARDGAEGLPGCITISLKEAFLEARECPDISLRVCLAFGSCAWTVIVFHCLGKGYQGS